MITKQAAHLERGAQAEAMAGDFLIRKGLQVIQRNFRVRGGEIDLVCQDGATTVFVEVRLRSSKAFGGAAASITASKQRRLVLAARHWLQRHGEVPCRFDCILMDALDADRIDWIQDAFSTG